MEEAEATPVELLYAPTEPPEPIVITEYVYVDVPAAPSTRMVQDVQIPESTSAAVSGASAPAQVASSAELSQSSNTASASGTIQSDGSSSGKKTASNASTRAGEREDRVKSSRRAGREDDD
jgi:hypothetical protein